MGCCRDCCLFEIVGWFIFSGNYIGWVSGGICDEVYSGELYGVGFNFNFCGLILGYDFYGILLVGICKIFFIIFFRKVYRVFDCRLVYLRV